ncbi:MAG: PAS domain S-box protein [Planctomycetes bacterium]|nr:PAS domain S-box protein [Planctomycetota bacterium]
MKRRCDAGESWEEKRARIIGLGEASLHKSYYPELRQRVAELERFRGLLDHAGDGIFLIQTPSGRVVDANEAAAELLGRARDALLAASIADLLPDPAGAAVAALCAGERREEAPGLTIAVPLARGDGSVLHLEVSARPVVFRREVYVVAVARDTSERRRLEEQLQQAQKMEAIGQLAGGMAHDFNNILTGILGNVELLAEELRRPGSDPAAWLEEVGRIEQGARRAAALTRQILLVSRRDVVRPADVDLNRTVICMREMLRRVIPEHTALDVDLAEDLRPVRADQGQIEQVVMNLVLNARDAMPEGGTLAIETARVDRAALGALAADAADAGTFVRLTVRDLRPRAGRPCSCARTTRRSGGWRRTPSSAADTPCSRQRTARRPSTSPRPARGGSTCS